MVCRPMGLYTYLSVFNFFIYILRFMGNGSIGSCGNVHCAHIERTLLQNCLSGISRVEREYKVCAFGRNSSFLRFVFMILYWQTWNDVQKEMGFHQKCIAVLRFSL